MDSGAFGNRYIDQRVRVERDAYTRRFAIDAVLRREVLITQLAGPIGRRAAAQESFSAEARAATRLSHPNIVTTYDTDTENGYPFAVQEFVHSETLRSIIDAEKPFHPDDVAVLIQAIADALSYARLRGMPHLALSPECVVVDYDGTVLVSDFGIGRVLAELEPPNPDTLPFIAPEITGPNTGDARSDIYSAGAIAYEMISGEPPLRPSTGSLMRLDVAAPQVPPAVGRVVMMALADSPQDRFRSIEAFATALSNATDPPAEPGSSDDEPAPQFRVLEPEPDETLQMDAVPLEPTTVTGKAPGRLTAVLAWCGLALGVLALGWVMFSFLSADDDPDPEVTRVANDGSLATSTVPSVPEAIPDLVGMTVEQAEQTRFEIVVAESRADSDVPAGQILAQTPQAGEAAGGSEISVIVSAGPTANVLDGLQLESLSFEQVSESLTERGLNVARQDEGSLDVQEGLVIGIVESSAAAGDTVTVRVSMGNRVQIPLDLQSRPLDEVEDVLDELGLTVNAAIPVSRERITAVGVDLDDFSIEDGDVVGFQEDQAGFGAWVEAGSSVTPVVYDADLT